MQNLGLPGKTGSKKQPVVNPFAQALAEQEKHSFAQNTPQEDNTLSEAFARTGNKGLSDNYNSFESNQLVKEELIKKQKKEALRKKLHDQVNNLDQVDVFNAREQKVLKELEKTREELKLLSKEIAQFHQEVDIVVTQQVVNPGQEGQYYLNFFAQLRRWIMMLRAKVRSARTWAKQAAAKKQKQKNLKGGGIDFKGAESKTVHNIMDNSELNNAYSGS